ncbi:hypothetical protein PG994_000167 [Apiospora phragmitis]|uniref:Fungal N-terminal domain-containing protein n=1 Tax=Apiospora phragmitis TaxID=2905665 RepID=A0ABR1X5P2_9PEZI
MAEVLRALASVLTITECISKAASLIIVYYKAPAQIEDLQTRIKTFHDAVRALEAASDTQDNFLTQALSSTSAIIEELDHFVKVELVQNATLSSRARRTAWLRSKSKISTLQQRLDHAQSIMRIALDVSQLNSRQSVESKLSIISQRTASTQETSHNDRAPVATPVTSSMNAVPPSLVRAFIGSEPGDMPPPLIIPDRAQLRSLTTNEADTDESGKGHCIVDHAGTKLPAPASPFELSSTFFPEMYTSMTATATIISYDLESVQDTSYARISQCSALFSPSPRKWLRITLSITISFDSSYWNLVHVNTVDMKWGNDGWSLPKRHNASVEDSLRCFDDLKQDSEVSFYLGPSHDHYGRYQPPTLHLETTNPSVITRKSLLEATKMAHHWYCPRYPESDIVTRTLHPHSKRSGSIACIGSQWTLLTRFTANKTDFDWSFYNMKISHIFHSTPGISRLLGLVYDQDDYLTGYLSKMATSPFKVGPLLADPLEIR